MTTELPLFAVVGHPNKGKSSVVAALTQDDRVEISPLSGTTRQAQRFRLTIDGRPVFELIDTPGFQRARACLEWLQEEPVSAEQRPARLAQFVENFADESRFSDEVELLRPITQGAGIIYVVDGSLPYNPVHEIEMEILRWSGQPRLALINPIGGNIFVDEWQRALGQYFSLVRVFDPMHASFEQHLQLMRTFSELGHWDFEGPIRSLQMLRLAKQQQAARLIVERLYRLLDHHIEVGKPVLNRIHGTDPVERFNRELGRIERESLQALEALFLHHDLHTRMDHLALLPGDLMDRELWSSWALERGRLTLVAGAAGAGLGLGADLLAGGQSLMLGSLGGGVAGGLSAWLGSDWLRRQLPDWTISQQRRHQIGPVKDPNFPFVILGRALQHAHAVLQRSHADRKPLTIDAGEQNLMQKLPQAEQVRLLKLAWQLRRGGLQGRAARTLEKWVLQRLTQ